MQYLMQMSALCTSNKDQYICKRVAQAGFSLQHTLLLSQHALKLEAIMEVSQSDFFICLQLLKPKLPQEDAKPAAAASEAQEFDTWVLPENTGRAYAALDGDISPMHLYKATAMLMGFPSPVANVHLLAARAEATIAMKKGACW